MTNTSPTYIPSTARFLSVDPLFEAFPNQSPFSYAYNNPISYRDPSGLAPEKEKGNKNQIQNMDYHELLKESWKQYNTEYQIQLGLRMELEKEGNLIFWNDQYNDLIRRANSIDIGIDYSVELAKQARQGRLGNGITATTETGGTITYSMNGYTFKINYTVKEGEDVNNAGFKILDALDWIADAGAFGERIMTLFAMKMSYSGKDLNINLTKTGSELASTWNAAKGTDYDFLGGFSSNKWMFTDGENSSSANLDIPDKSAHPIYIASDLLHGDLIRDELFFKSESRGMFAKPKPIYSNFSMVFAHEFKHKFDSMFFIIPIPKEPYAIKFVNQIYNYYHP